MILQDALKELEGFDINDLDFENMGSWPIIVKVVVWVVIFSAVIALGYTQDISDLQGEQVRTAQKETELRAEFSRKAGQATNLDAYRRQMLEMEESFGALVSQLPSDTEVPGLLEDITNKGRDNGLEIKSIKLETERALEFYVELPIAISVEGTYHDIGSFVSGIAGLPRIVTLHDFGLKDLGSGRLEMNITAKTYRYKEIDEG
ncbi:type 4a pilus biogenesis protein PilO [Dasania marina]|uniref:type 4a pilus biogenesis protein PilO n=1 Tax=Dasania marina TaxID=471499 RepID=UPI0030DBA437|tara:strand:- start:75580 stop:76191 length:612 start_codon:yes stop_codon:yes gene_type:complete